MRLHVLTNPQTTPKTYSSNRRVIFHISENEFYYTIVSDGVSQSEGVTTPIKKPSLEKITHKIEKVYPGSNMLTAVTGFIDKDLLHVEGAGFGIVLLKRAGTVGNILSGVGKVYGKVENGDVIAICEKADEKSVKDSLVHSTSLIYPPDILLLQVRQDMNSRVGADRIGPIRGFLDSHIVPLLHPKDAKSRIRRTLFLVSIILIVLLGFSIFLNSAHTRNSKRSKLLGETLVVVSQQYEEAVSVVELNPVRSRELLASAKLSLSPLLSQFSKKSSEYTTVSEWLTKIGIAEVLAYRIFKLTAVAEFFDLNLIRSGAQGNKFSAYGTTKAIVDRPNKAVYTLTTDEKQAQVVAGGSQVGDPPTVSVHGEYVYTVGSEGISRIDISTQSTQLAIAREESWGTVVDIAAYAGNLYLLDATHNSIIKYIASEDGFTPGSSYINPGTSADISHATRLVIDGSVWVVTPSELLKFTRGAPESFSLTGFSDTIAGIDAMSTSDEEKYLYILDKSLSRIVVFDKDGVYQAQYQWDELRDASDIVATEKEKKIYVLKGSKIYAIDLK